ncbi:hypothetical protein AAIB33_15995 [Microbacterium sp. AZCO]|uniref:hypothetical protein n=1 Tax=Microbacterium sp. AZCO TaxID=3142976 RepID=UPI0031F4353B
MRKGTRRAGIGLGVGIVLAIALASPALAENGSAPDASATTQDAVSPVVATIAAPTWVDPCGTADDRAVLPADTLGIHYRWAQPEDSRNHDVIANTNVGYVVSDLPAGWSPLDGEYLYTWTYRFTDVPCGTAEPMRVSLMAPTWVDACGTADDRAVLPADTVGIHYRWAHPGDPTDHDVIANTNEGYVVAELPAGWTAADDGGYLYSWTHAFTDEACAVPLTSAVGAGRGLTRSSSVSLTAIAATADSASALAATGDADLSRTLLGAAALLVLGAGVIVWRRMGHA